MLTCLSSASSLTTTASSSPSSPPEPLEANLPAFCSYRNPSCRRPPPRRRPQRPPHALPARRLRLRRQHRILGRRLRQPNKERDLYRHSIRPQRPHQTRPARRVALAHPQLPRLWAQARVNALLDQIARDGETREAIDEIIRLSRRYKFVTPYTSFLAVPRSLLRPRIIRPGDPVLRVHTDPSITSVIALFPFGLTKSLRHIESEDNQNKRDPDRLWETRFLAPTDMKDGTYTVRLLLRDAVGHTWSEAKTFVIASTPPAVRISL